MNSGANSVYITITKHKKIKEQEGNNKDYNPLNTVKLRQATIQPEARPFHSLRKA
jgi:hypothetical protein